jgi:glycosyltransferase involved in cell wall biosynthesis
MATCMSSVLLDSEFQKNLRQNGILRARQFSWERCAQETLQVLMRAGKGR